MEMEIKKLTPKVLDDYLEFFDNIAFSDGSEWSGCYCVWYHWKDELDEEWTKLDDNSKSDYNRNLAIKMINEGVLNGYLAYQDGKPIGWCNTNDRNQYDRLSINKRPDVWEDVKLNEKVKSIVCFTVAPNMRKKGISKALLNRVCKDATKEGYIYVEGYPGISRTDERSYHGPITIFEKAGFSVVRELKSEAIVRKYL